MSRQLRVRISAVLSMLVVLAGCHPTQPFFYQEDGDLSHYLDRATDLEYPDVCQASLAEVTQSHAPLTISDPDPREIWDLTLEEVVSIALQNSKVIRNLGGVTQFGFADGLVGRTGSSATVYDAAIVESDPQGGVAAALSAFDAQLSVLGTNNGNFFSQTDRPSTFQAGSVVFRDSGGMRSELSKRSATGTQMFVRNQTDYTRGDNLIGFNQPVDSIWETLFEVEVRQPILRGRGTQINRVPIMLARINTDISLATFEASVRNLVLDIEDTYWDLYLAYRLLDTAKTARDSAQVTWKTVYERYVGGVADVQAEAQAREQYFFFRAALERALTTLYDTESRLRFLMGLSASDGRLIRPVDEPTLARVEFDWRVVLTESLMRSPELRQQKWAIKRRELELIAARNQLLPQLDLGATYRWYGIGDHLINAERNGKNFVDADRVGSTAFDVLTEGRYQEAAFFMSFQMPVGYRREMAGVRNAQLGLAREKARLEDMELNTSHLLSTSLRALDFNYQNAQTQFNRWKASIREVESVEALYRGGKTSLDLVLDAQRRRAEAERDYYQAVVDYNKALAECHFRKGSLLEYNNISLAEGPWPEKAYWDALERARERDASYYFDYGWTRPSVVSQGPVAQQQGTPQVITDQPIEPLEEPTPAEPIPTPEPTPAEPEESPQEPGPITSLPNGPELNEPRLRADTDSPPGRPIRVADRPEQPFAWGDLGLGKSDKPDTSQ